MKSLEIIKEELDIGIPYAKENLRYIEGKFFDPSYKKGVLSRETLLREAVSELYELENKIELLSKADLCTSDCIYYLSDNGNFPSDPCPNCSRFYSDYFESNKAKL